METLPPPIRVSPPLLNSANPWATTQEDLKALFECPSVGAVTTRTSLLEGFPHDAAIHQYTFFDPSKHHSPASSSSPAGSAQTASLNTLGYSPIPLDDYLSYIASIAGSLSAPSTKSFIVSVTGTPEEVAECYRRIARLAGRVSLSLAMEVNLSCPNIPNKPPPAYSGESLALYISAIRDAAGARRDGEECAAVPWGLKTPPYTYAGQFETLVSVLRAASADGDDNKPCPVSFLTATNTLGSCLVLDDAHAPPPAGGITPKLAGGTGIGGMAGAPLHPLALGNVATLRRMLDAHEDTRHVSIIGVGGVEDAAGYRRMRSVGALAVAVGTALGRKGVRVFEEIEEGLNGACSGKWKRDDVTSGDNPEAILIQFPESERPEREPAGKWKLRLHRFRPAVQRFFSSRTQHWLILVLIILDVADILSDIFIGSITCELGKRDEAWVGAVRGALSTFALITSCIFMLELALSVFAYGLAYFKDRLHCFDAFVIVVGFGADLLEQGPAKQIASLVVMLRLWRIVKLVDEVPVQASEQTEDLQKEIGDLKKQNQELRAQVTRYGPRSSEEGRSISDS
ncbi:hypothetical protein DL764_005160 [Monosporascus ibericus]|uniref:Dihydroorotate dehydrogenase (fumarate) n=1 Tax=Monosporascus ibericus TaxID=155417 RepID=A0A4Q4T9V7_9PEZI|nr:hypothetical protein DL764_005160 [Monosporascus ibericus]